MIKSRSSTFKQLYSSLPFSFIHYKFLSTKALYIARDEGHLANMELSILYMVLALLTAGARAQDYTISLFVDGCCERKLDQYELYYNTCVLAPVNVILYSSQFHAWYTGMVCEYYYDYTCGGDTFNSYRVYSDPRQNNQQCFNPGLVGLTPPPGYKSFFCWHDDASGTFDGYSKRAINGERTKPQIKEYIQLGNSTNIGSARSLPTTANRRQPDAIKTTETENLKTPTVRTFNPIQSGDQYRGSGRTGNGFANVVAVRQEQGQTGFPGGSANVLGQAIGNSVTDQIYNSGQSTYVHNEEYTTVEVQVDGLSAGLQIVANRDFDFNTFPNSILSSVVTDMAETASERGWDGIEVVLSGTTFVMTLLLVGATPAWFGGC
jgi:hypothetical protein